MGQLFPLFRCELQLFRPKLLKKLIFPAPLGPITANEEPESICRETSVTATVFCHTELQAHG